MLQTVWTYSMALTPGGVGVMQTSEPALVALVTGRVAMPSCFPLFSLSLYTAVPRPQLVHESLWTTCGSLS